jgi:hypothetical protein
LFAQVHDEKKKKNFLNNKDGCKKGNYEIIIYIRVRWGYFTAGKLGFRHEARPSASLVGVL